MKKPFLLFVALCLCAVQVAWAQVPALQGKIVQVNEPATELRDGQWYVLYNAALQRYVQQSADGQLALAADSPNNTAAPASAGMLLQLLPQADGRYLIRTGMGSYIQNVVVGRNNGTVDEPTDVSPFTIAPIEGHQGHFTLMSTLRNGNKVYVNATAAGLSGAMGAGTAGSGRDWTFLQVSLSGTSELRGEAYVEYALSQFQLVRLTNRRSSGYSLADNGTKTLGQPTRSESLEQVWILDRQGTGYTLRNGHTGRFLDDNDNFRAPSATPTTIHIRYSPNNTAGTSWINLAEDGSFGGNVCLNENGNSPADLYKWTAQGDAGSDWTISEVKNFTLEQVLDGLLANSKYRPVESGTIYRLVNTGYGNVAFENTMGNQVSCQAADPNKIAQYWRVTREEGRYYLQNVLTQRYLRRQNGALSRIYSTSAPEQKSAANNGFTLTRTANATDHTYTITDQGNVGLHCDASNNMVGWYADNDNSIWGFEVADVTPEQIEAARQAYAEYMGITRNVATLNAHLAELFADKACTQLHPHVAALSAHELAALPAFAALNPTLQAVVMKVKDNTWQQFTHRTTGYTAPYEQFFRVANYQVYSHHSTMAGGQYTAMSNAFGRLSNPTGISGYTGDVVYLFVEGPVSPDCTLAVETVTGTNRTGQQTTLQPGLNAIMLGDQSNLYIFYELKDPTKYLANYPDVKVHIEGGRLNGYWDATRGMTNQDWKLLQQDLLKESPVLNLKTEHLVFCMETPYLLAAEPNEIEGITRVWEQILVNQERLMGLEEFDGRLRNVWNAYSVDHNYMYATTYGTYYHRSTLSTVMNYHAMTHQGEGNEGGGMWGPSHEIGHNHQNTINVVGAMEASNNMFSNINVFEQGVSTTRYSSPVANFDKFNQGQHWHQRGIEIKTRLYFQLYLYFHEMKNDTTFLPRLFSHLRRRPINRQGNGWNGSLSDGEHHGGYDTRGSMDYLHLAKAICDVAQADLSEMFEAYGMFVPMEKVYVGDYADYFVTTTQQDIDLARAYMQRYPRKLGNIMFIDDHIAMNQKANPNNKFEAVPAASGYKVNCCTYAGSKMGTAGDVGQYTDFHPTFQATDYFYTMNIYTRQVRIQGQGAVGFKVYSPDGRLVYLSNKASFTLPKEIVDAGFVLKAAEGNGHDIVVPRGNAHPMADVYYAGQTEPRELYAAPGLSLPANALAIVRSGQENELDAQVKQMTNVVDEAGQATLVCIDGTLPWHAPAAIQASEVQFTLDGQGWTALHLPFAIDNAMLPGLHTVTYADGILSLTPAERVAPGQPVAVNGPISIRALQATIQPGTYLPQTHIPVLSADGTAVETASQAGPFIFPLTEGTALTPVWAERSNPTAESIYDLQGRRLPAQPTQRGLYIKGKQKVLVR